MRGPARKPVLRGALLALVSVIAAAQGAHASTPAPAERVAAEVARASGSPSGLSSGAIRLAIHVNREKVESGEGDNGGAADEESGDEQDEEGDRDAGDSGDEEASESSPGEED